LPHFYAIDPTEVTDTRAGMPHSMNRKVKTGHEANTRHTKVEEIFPGNKAADTSAYKPRLAQCRTLIQINSRRQLDMVIPDRRQSPR
jgi:hypothetical protein